MLKTGIRIWLTAVFAFFTVGCAGVPVALLPAALPTIISGAGGGISYTMTNVAYKVTTFPIDDVDLAVLKALRKMSIDITEKKDTRQKIKIAARTRKLYIYITLEFMTPTLTTLKVNAKKSLFFKDKTAAYEIIYQTERFLSGIEDDMGQILKSGPIGRAR